MALDVAAIFIIFVASGAGTMVPILSKKIPLCRANSIFMEAISAFSFGVVIATGLIHMVNEGVDKLNNEALGHIVDDYQCLGLMFVLITLVLMHLIECESAVFFGSKGSMLHGHSHTHAHSDEHSGGNGHSHDDTTKYKPGAHVHSDEHLSAVQPADSIQKKKEKASRESTIRRRIATIIFEAGVIFHSVIVGVDLGVTDSEFKTLLTALSFHQFFEGVAVGSASVSSITERRKLFIVNMAFAITTPIGQVIGLGIKKSYSSSSPTSLWVQGILDCIAGGILLYTGLVELLTYNMTTNQQFLSRSASHRFTLYCSLWLGAGMMALIGKWT